MEEIHTQFLFLLLIQVSFLIFQYLNPIDYQQQLINN